MDLRAEVDQAGETLSLNCGWMNKPLGHTIYDAATLEKYVHDLAANRYLATLFERRRSAHKTKRRRIN
jgi:hypothetical protein